MFSNSRRAGSELAAADLVLTSRRSPWAFVGPVMAIIVLIALVVVGVIYLEQQMAIDEMVSRLERENSVLQARNLELEQTAERALLDLEIGAVTQLELERQLVVLNERVKQLEEELEFVKNAGN